LKPISADTIVLKLTVESTKRIHLFVAIVHRSGDIRHPHINSLSLLVLVQVCPTALERALEFTPILPPFFEVSLPLSAGSTWIFTQVHKRNLRPQSIRLNLFQDGFQHVCIKQEMRPRVEIRLDSQGNRLSPYTNGIILG